MSINIEDFQELMNSKPELLERDKEIVLASVQKLKVTYGSEISRDTLIPRERTTQLIYQLLKENKIFRLKLNPNLVPIELKERMGHFWSIGIHGYDNFAKIIFVIAKPQIPYSYYYDGVPVIPKDEGPMKIKHEMVE